MKTAQEIYEEYRIMPSLQLHQLRVAAVAQTLCENFEHSVDQEAVVTACLFHDMGNIIKSDFAIFPEFSKPEGVEYWEEVKKKFIAKYGKDHHTANVAIAREIQLSEKAYKLLSGIGLSQIEKMLHEGSPEQMVCEYSDLRVGPHGVLSMKERLAEGRKRYLARTEKSEENFALSASEESFSKLERASEDLEKRIFENEKISPGDITDEKIQDVIEGLRNFSVA